MRRGVVEFTEECLPGVIVDINHMAELLRKATGSAGQFVLRECTRCGCIVATVNVIESAMAPCAVCAALKEKRRRQEADHARRRRRPRGASE